MGAEVIPVDAGDFSRGTPYVSTTKTGLKIGFIGIDTPVTQTSANPALIRGLSFAANDLYACIQKQIDALKDDNLVIALSYLGTEDFARPYTS